MEKRERAIRLYVRVNEEEKRRIDELMQQSNCKSFNTYARNMLLHGQVIVPDWQNLKEIHRQLAGVGVNINQIAHRVNATHLVYKADMENIHCILFQLWVDFHRCVKSMSRMERKYGA